VLILTRKRGECIIIGEGDRAVTVTVEEIRGDKVRLAVEAPRDVLVLRQELLAAAGGGEEGDR
jgi:carbon storage regulator